MVGAQNGSSITALATAIGSSPSTILREADRLEAAGIVRSERVGRTRLIWVNEESPYTRPLRELIEIGFGPRPLVTNALRSVDGVEEAFIFGSWAISATEPTSTPANDVDVLVIGDPDRSSVYSALQPVEERIGREIDVIFRSAAQWHAADEPFLQTIKSRPLIRLDLRAE
jgi:predicted nucleotidyltransferase